MHISMHLVVTFDFAHLVVHYSRHPRRYFENVVHFSKHKNLTVGNCIVRNHIPLGVCTKVELQTSLVNTREVQRPRWFPRLWVFAKGILVDLCFGHTIVLVTGDHLSEKPRIVLKTLRAVERQSSCFESFKLTIDK